MTYKASEGPRRTIQDKRGVAAFVNAVFDADGNWVEMPQGDISTTNLRNAVLLRIGAAVSEVSVRDDVIYARMRKGT